MKRFLLFLICAILFPACSYMKESTPAKNLSAGSKIIMEKNYFSPVYDDPETGIQLTEDALNQRPDKYKITYESSKTLDQFNGKMLMKEDKNIGWEMSIEGGAFNAKVHAKEALDADIGRAKAGVEGTQVLVDGAAKAGAAVISGGASLAVEGAGNNFSGAGQ